MAEAPYDNLENALVRAVADANVGEYFGSSTDELRTELSMHGPDVDALWSVVEPLVVDTRYGPGSHVVKRYGDIGSPETVITLT
jgi:hypothetical protein